MKVSELTNRNMFLQNKKILVIEDDKTMTVLLGRVLLDMNSDIEIHWAVSLEQAVKQLIQNTDIEQNQPYALVIADIFLEGNGTGLDFFKLMKETYPSIPFLVISSLAFDQVFDALDGGTDRSQLTYLRKPFGYNQCKEKVQEILTELQSKEGLYGQQNL